MLKPTQQMIDMIMNGEFKKGKWKANVIRFTNGECVEFLKDDVPLYTMRVPTTLARGETVTLILEGIKLSGKIEIEGSK